MAIELLPHQEKAINEMHNGCVLWGGVGTGKTITALTYFYTKVCCGVVNDMGSMRTPTDLYIITTARKRDSKDWENDAAYLKIFADQDLNPGAVKMTVDSWNNIANYEDVKDAFFIFDEQRVVGSGAWQNKFLKIAKNNKWILLTATPGDTWLDYIPLFIANGFYPNRTAFKREHVVYNTYSKFPKVDRFTSVGKLVRHKNAILVEMPYTRHTERSLVDTHVEYDEELFRKATVDRWHVYEQRPIRDVGELFIVMRKVVNSHYSRIGAIREIMGKHPKLIVFYSFDYELENLRALGEACTDVTFAEWNGHKHEPVPDTERWVYLVQYMAGSEAWNCVETDAMVFYSLTYSYKIFEQSQGRIDRLNTPFTRLYYYLLKSDSLIDKAIWKSLRNKQNFNESDFSRAA